MSAPLPRPLRDRDFTRDLRAADVAAKRDKFTGSVSVEFHYRDGDPLRAKVITERTMDLSVGKDEP